MFGLITRLSISRRVIKDYDKEFSRRRIGDTIQVRRQPLFPRSA